MARIFISLMLAVIFCIPAEAQSSGAVSGVVSDPAGDAVPGANVRLFNLLTGFSREALTDAGGGFSITNVPLQSYQIEVTADGFRAVRRIVVLDSNVPARLRMPLSILAQSETVSVSATDSLTLLDARATGTRTELSRNAIEKLPVPAGARGLEAILLSFPGFAANANGAIHPRGAHNQMTYVIDGIPISDQFTGSFATSIDPSLVQSIELHTGDIPAEFGSKVSGVADITTRSGLDFSGERFGLLELGGGGFDTLSQLAQAGGSRGKLGYFLSASNVKSNRFLDTPSLDNLHNGGNAQRGFGRFDYQINDRTFLRANLMAGRSSFQLANLRSQHAAGQQQRRSLSDATASVGLLRVISPGTTFDTTNSFRATNAQLAPSAGDTPVTSSLSRGLSTFSTLNRLTHVRGRHNFRFGADYMHFPVREDFSFAITDPGFNAPGSEGFNPNLLPHDLSRGGDWFRFSSKSAGDLATAFVQDRITLGPLIASLGLRFDSYRFLVKGEQLQPRLGVAYHIESTGTVLRASYNRNYQTPPNENLLLSNSEEASALAPPEVRRDLNGGVILMRPQRQNVYEAGVQQRLSRWASLNAVYYHKNSNDLQDNDNFLNTGIIFPTSLAKSRVNGFEARLTVPEYRNFTGSLSLTHYHVVVTPPFTGGLFLGAAALEALSAGPFIIDHDQALGVSSVVMYRPRRQWWTSWQMRYDSGLVSNPSDPAEVAQDPDYFDQLPFVNLNADPPRVRPRTIVDFAVGYEGYRADRRLWEIVFQLSNLTNRTALYNFQSVFVGTRAVQPRAASVKLRWYF